MRLSAAWKADCATGRPLGDSFTCIHQKMFPQALCMRGRLRRAQLQRADTLRKLSTDRCQQGIRRRLSVLKVANPVDRRSWYSYFQIMALERFLR